MGAGKKGRVAWIDWLRACGACAIVLLHVLVSTQNACDLGLVREVSYTAIGVALCRWAVPAFFMISGYLLLDPSKVVTWSHVGRYAKRMLVVLATFGLLFALMEETVLQLGEGMTLGVAFAGKALLHAAWDVLTGNSWDHLWYVYALLGVYLLLPGIRHVQGRLGDTGFAVLVGLLFVGVLVVPTLMAESAPNVLVGLTCFCVGGCLRRARFGWWTVVLGLASLAAMLVISVGGILQGEGDQNHVFLQGSFLASAYAVLVVTGARHMLGDATIDGASVVGKLARDSFGVYVLHPLFVHLGLMVVDPTMMPVGLYEVAFFAVALAASIACTRLLRHVPLLQDVL